MKRLIKAWLTASLLTAAMAASADTVTLKVLSAFLGGSPR